jgi:hypothetical protein
MIMSDCARLPETAQKRKIVKGVARSFPEDMCTYQIAWWKGRNNVSGG